MQLYTLNEIAKIMNISTAALYFNTQLKGFPSAVSQNDNYENLYDLDEINAWEHNRPVNLTPIN
jgi:hypothetical protein